MTRLAHESPTPPINEPLNYLASGYISVCRVQSNGRSRYNSRWENLYGLNPHHPNAAEIERFLLRMAERWPPGNVVPNWQGRPFPPHASAPLPQTFLAQPAITKMLLLLERVGAIRPPRFYDYGGLSKRCGSGAFRRLEMRGLVRREWLPKVKKQSEAGLAPAFYPVLELGQLFHAMSAAYPMHDVFGEVEEQRGADEALSDHAAEEN